MATVPATQDKVLSDDQVAFYHRHGYLILENVLSAAELQELRTATEGLREERIRRGGKDNIVAIMDFALLDDAFMRAACSTASSTGNRPPKAPAKWTGTRTFLSCPIPTMTCSPA